MIQERQLVSIFCEIDDFCKELDKNMSQLQLTGPSKGRRGPAQPKHNIQWKTLRF